MNHKQYNIENCIHVYIFKDIREQLSIHEDIPDEAIINRLGYMFYYLKEIAEVRKLEYEELRDTNDNWRYVSLGQKDAYEDILNIMTRDFNVEEYKINEEENE